MASQKQSSGTHGSESSASNTEPTVYCGKVVTLKDQAENGGWTRHRVIGGEDMPRQVMGTEE